MYGNETVHEEQIRMKILRILMTGMIPFICLVGIVGNSMAVLLIQTHHYLKRLASNRYLCFLSLCSCTVLCCHMAVFLESAAPKKLKFYRSNDSGCKVITFLGTAADFAAVWLIVAVCIDRVFLVYRPVRRIETCSLKAASKFVVLVLILSLLFNAIILVYAAHISIEGMEDYCGVLEHFIEAHEIFSWLETCFGVLIPWIIILAANVAVLIRLRTFQIWRNVNSTVRFSSSVDFANRNGTNSTILTTPRIGKSESFELFAGESPDTSNPTDESERNEMTPIVRQPPLAYAKPINGSPSLMCNGKQHGSKQRQSKVSFNNSTTMSGCDMKRGLNIKPKDVQITKALLWVTTLFVLLNLPSYLVRILLNDGVQTFWLSVVWSISYFLSYCHHAAVFYVYIFNSPQMRKLLKPTALRLLECYCLKTVPDFGHNGS